MKQIVVDRFRKALERLKRPFIGIEEALGRFSKTHPSAATNEDRCEY